jgi:hypothetical protein
VLWLAWPITELAAKVCELPQHGGLSCEITHEPLLIHVSTLNVAPVPPPR